MDSEKINEPVRVLAGFENRQAKPLLFFWNGRLIKNLKLNFCHSFWQGRGKVYIFSVSNENASYRLSFDSETLEWKLEETNINR